MMLPLHSDTRQEWYIGRLILIFISWPGLAGEIQDRLRQTGMYGHPTYKSNLKTAESRPFLPLKSKVHNYFSV